MDSGALTYPFGTIDWPATAPALPNNSNVYVIKTRPLRARIDTVSPRGLAEHIAPYRFGPVIRISRHNFKAARR